MKKKMKQPTYPNMNPNIGSQQPLQSTIVQRQYQKNALRQRAKQFNSAASAANMTPDKFASHVIANASQHSQSMVAHARTFKNDPNSLISE